MKNKFDNVYQFKITLRDCKPPIWRRIQVPETSTFWDLHVAIQDAMGWIDYHLHQFIILHPKRKISVNIGIPLDDYESPFEVMPGWRQDIRDWYNTENKTARYEYDFGDSWIHSIMLEKISPREKGVKYPVCVKGKRACPPEDCGGIGGYEDLVQIMQNSNHEQREMMVEWLCLDDASDFDPEYFDPKEVEFDNPAERLKEFLER